MRINIQPANLEKGKRKVKNKYRVKSCPRAVERPQVYVHPWNYPDDSPSGEEEALPNFGEQG
jgi:hypothetical protein